MVKKHPITSEISSNKNELSFIGKKINEEPRVKIKIYDYTGKPIDSHTKLKLKHEQNKIDIILTFFPTKAETEIEEGEVIASYLLFNKSSREQYLENKKRALIDNLYKKKLENVDKKLEIEQKEDNLNNLDDIKCAITRAPSDPTKNNKIQLKVKIWVGGEEYDILDQNQRLFAYFSIPNRIEYDELITFPSPSKTPKPF